MHSRNFEFLREARDDLAALGGFAEHYAFNDPARPLVKLRLFAERIADLIFESFRRPSPNHTRIIRVSNKKGVSQAATELVA